MARANEDGKCTPAGVSRPVRTSTKQQKGEREGPNDNAVPRENREAVTADEPHEGPDHDGGRGPVDPGTGPAVRGRGPGPGGGGLHHQAI